MLPSTAAAAPESSREQNARYRFGLDGCERWLVAVFLLSLPLVNPWVHGDGVGYYAYARALLIEHRLDFAPDWKHANQSFILGREDAHGNILPSEYTETGHLRNLWSIGPSMLWLPFLAVTHGGVILADHLGARIPADGFSAPYRYTMALATCFYGFLGLWLSFLLARAYFDGKWASLATIGIWGASSLTVYMYFNPSWSHALSAFVVALFLWYWHRTRQDRSLGQWILLGLISGLMVDVYYPNGIFLLVPLLEAATEYAGDWKAAADSFGRIVRRLRMHIFYVGAFAFALLPTLISRRIIFGSPVRTGYYQAHAWRWTSPALWSVLFSADHGLLAWTPILIAACAGLILFLRVDRAFAAKLIACAVAFYLLIAFYPDWDGLSSFGNRFFVSLTPIFILGLAALFDRLARAWNPRRTFALTAPSTALLILWNFGMMYQWGMHLVPVRGPISWREAVYNQFAVVPSHAARDLERYFLRRGKLMQHIENEDVRQLKAQSH
jgi:Dolichyl-phosphate-mannose-protein mannosyltransferase